MIKSKRSQCHIWNYIVFEAPFLMMLINEVTVYFNLDFCLIYIFISIHTLNGIKDVISNTGINFWSPKTLIGRTLIGTFMSNIQYFIILGTICHSIYSPSVKLLSVNTEQWQGTKYMFPGMESFLNQMDSETLLPTFSFTNLSVAILEISKLIVRFCNKTVCALPLELPGLSTICQFLDWQVCGRPD